MLLLCFIPELLLSVSFLIHPHLPPTRPGFIVFAHSRGVRWLCWIVVALLACLSLSIILYKCFNGLWDTHLPMLFIQIKQPFTLLKYNTLMVSQKNVLKGNEGICILPVKSLGSVRLRSDCQIRFIAGLAENDNIGDIIWRIINIFGVSCNEFYINLML